MNKKRLFPKCQLILNFRLQIMHDYVHWPCSIDYLAFYQGLELSFVYGALTCSSAIPASLCSASYLVATASKIKWGVFDEDYRLLC